MIDDDLVREFLDSKVYAVVGVSPNRDKYGYKVHEDLKRAGYTVYAVNPSYEEIYGEPCYPDIRSIPEKPDVVEFVCPPRVTEQIVKSLPGLGIDKAWMQPGAESTHAIEFCSENCIKVLSGICIMVERRKRPPC